MWSLFIILFNLALTIIVDANSFREYDPQIKNSKDGYLSGFIANGKITRKGDFPWLVALTDLSKKPKRIFCGGAMISEIMIITVSS